MYVGELGQILPDLISDPIAAWVGDGMAPELEKEFGGPHPSATLQNYVNEIGRRLVKAQNDRKDFPGRFMVLASEDVVNAFAIGNGNVYVTYGLMRILENEAEFASVVGHEIGHVTRRHINKTIEEGVGTTILLGLAESLLAGKRGEEENELAAQLTAIGAALVRGGFSRSYENEADGRGLKYAIQAGYDPSGIVGVMKKFQSMEAKVTGLEYYFRSHPLAEERVSALESRIRSRYPNVKGEIGRERYLSIVHGLGGAVQVTWEAAKPYAIAVGTAGAVLLGLWGLSKVV